MTGSNYRQLRRNSRLAPIVLARTLLAITFLCGFTACSDIRKGDLLDAGDVSDTDVELLDVADDAVRDIFAGNDGVDAPDPGNDVESDAIGDARFDVLTDTDFDINLDALDVEIDAGCQPDCTLRNCGPDPVCGESCGSCVGGTCESGACVETPKVLIPTGSFWMGCNAAVDGDCAADELPYHEVTLSGYYIDKTEVTQAAYLECVNAGVCGVPSCIWEPDGNPDNPVVCVDWDGAVAYCSWADKRLPTEAEWEKAARGSDGSRYPWGNQTATCDYAVMNDATVGGSGCGADTTMTVCSRSPAGDSPYGLCDVAGNVWEWVSDWYSDDYYATSPSLNPAGPSTGDYRFGRGGGFDGGSVYVRSTNRPSADVWNKPNTVGFRCAQDCVPDCTLRECGDDGCGGSCGTCAVPETCEGAGVIGECGWVSPSCSGEGTPCDDANPYTLDDVCLAGTCYG